MTSPSAPLQFGLVTERIPIKRLVFKYVVSFFAFAVLVLRELVLFFIRQASIFHTILCQLQKPLSFIINTSARRWFSGKRGDRI